MHQGQDPVKGSPCEPTQQNSRILKELTAERPAVTDIDLSINPLPGVDLELVYKVSGNGSSDGHMARLISDISRERTFDYGTINIPDEILDVMEHTPFIQTARTIGFEPIITSGLAAGLYGSPRLISIDIDFTMRQSAQMEGDLKRLLDTVTGKSTELIHLPKGFAPCLGIFTSIESPGIGGNSAAHTKVDLDGLAICRFRPSPRGFAYEFGVDQHDLRCCRRVSLPNGNSISLIPPEHILFYKLLAARGQDVGKYDLMDAGAIIINAPLDAKMILKLITRQDYHTSRAFEKLDGMELVQLADSYGNLSGQTEEQLTEAGVTRREVRDGLVSWLQLAAEKSELSSLATQEARHLVVATIKQIALVSRLLESLDATANSLRESAPSSASGDSICLADIDPTHKFNDGVGLIRATLALCTPSRLFQQNLAQKLQSGSIA